MSGAGLPVGQGVDLAGCRKGHLNAVAYKAVGRGCGWWGGLYARYSDCGQQAPVGQGVDLADCRKGHLNAVAYKTAGRIR